MGDFKAQELAITTWAFVTVGQPAARLFTALARAAEQHLSDLAPQTLANTAWSFATVGHPEAQLFMALARAAEQHMGGFNVKSLPETIWALSRCVSLRDAWSLFGKVAAIHFGWPEFWTTTR